MSLFLYCLTNQVIKDSDTEVFPIKFDSTIMGVHVMMPNVSLVMKGL